MIEPKPDEDEEILPQSPDIPDSFLARAEPKPKPLGMEEDEDEEEIEVEKDKEVENFPGNSINLGTNSFNLAVSSRELKMEHLLNVFQFLFYEYVLKSLKNGKQTKGYMG